MDAEIQRRRTFEIIAKWIGKQNGITIEFHPNICPHADPKKRIIRLPSNIKEENLDKVIALVLHEAAHIAKSQFNTQKIVSNMEEMNVLNAVEDIRVDNHNMGYLPRIRDFYEALIEWEKEHKTDPAKVPIEHKVLCDLIRLGTGFHNDTFKDPKVTKIIDDNDLNYKVNDIKYLLDTIECNNFSNANNNDVKRKIKEVTDIIFGKSKRTPMPPPPTGKGQSNGKKGEGIPAAGDNAPNGQQDEQGNKDGNDKGGFGCGKYAPLFDIDPNAKYALDEVSLDEQTVQAFTELLKIKSIRIVHDGMELDTSNLTAFFTGDIDELFKEVKIEKHKKSKIMLLLDSSGSMHCNDGLVDKQHKTDILIAVGTRLARILDEIHEVEGVNVDYDVRAFDTRYIKLPKENWANDYLSRNGGGTNCAFAVLSAMEEIMSDKTIDGNKMIILITDGQVDMQQIDIIRDSILKNCSDVKCLILGIGLQKQFEDICGGRNIISHELADGCILEAIEDMLES